MIQVVNKRTHQPTSKDIYIGRPSPLGNPFSHLHGTLADYKVATREQAIDCYRRWLWKHIQENHPETIQALRMIEDDSILVCWCKPAACHGDVIVRAWEWLRQQGRLNQ